MAGNFQWSGYLAAVASVLTTELNSLADGQVTQLSPEQDNTTNKSVYADFQLDLASLTIASTTAFCTIYVVPTVDGTNYPDWSSGAVANYHAQYHGGVVLVKNVSAATARANAQGILIPPGKFKIALRNGTGAAFAAASNTLGIRLYDLSYT